MPAESERFVHWLRHHNPEARTWCLVAHTLTCWTLGIDWIKAIVSGRLNQLG